MVVLVMEAVLCESCGHKCHRHIIGSGCLAPISIDSDNPLLTQVCSCMLSFTHAEKWKGIVPRVLGIKYTWK